MRGTAQAKLTPRLPLPPLTSSYNCYMSDEQKHVLFVASISTPEKRVKGACSLMGFGAKPHINQLPT